MNLSVFAVFLAGVVSFLSPCVLPLVPGYMSMISGAGVRQLREGREARPVLLQHALLFILGFSAVFISLGAIASSVGRLAARHTVLLSEIAGVVIVAFGLHLTRIVPLRWLYASQQLAAGVHRAEPWRALLIGFAFGFGWTPCVGPILAAILALAASEATLARGVGLLALYSLGLALPFLATSLGVGRFLGLYQRFRHHLAKVELAAGTLMIAIGVLVFTRHLTLVNAWLSDVPFMRSLAERFL